MERLLAFNGGLANLWVTLMDGKQNIPSAINFPFIEMSRKFSRNLKEIWELVCVKLNDLVTYWTLHLPQTKLSNIFFSFLYQQRYLHINSSWLQVVNNLCGKVQKEIHVWLRVVNTMSVLQCRKKWLFCHLTGSI